MRNVKEGKKDRAYRELKQLVLSLELAPGMALDEGLLSQQFGLSRTPLREVFQRLSGEGYVSLATNRGATVSSMDLATMRNFFQSAPMIYAAIARLATEQATQPQLASLKKTQSAFRKAVDMEDFNNMSWLNHRFHEQIGEMAASPYLTPSLGRLLIDHTRMSHRFYRVQSDSSSNRIVEASDQHDAMIDSIEQGTPALTVELTLQHWELSRVEIDKYVLPDPLPIDVENYLQGIH